MRYIINNYGKTPSLVNIRDYFKENENSSINIQTISKYISLLENKKL